MAPTRELAVQIEDEFYKLSQGTNLNAVCIIGGRNAESQGLAISRGVEVVIGTPGRLQDLLSQHQLVLNQCYYLVLDEADKMVDLGLEEAVNGVLGSIPDSISKGSSERDVERQLGEMDREEKLYKTILMFSATMQP